MLFARSISNQVISYKLDMKKKLHTKRLISENKCSQSLHSIHLIKIRVSSRNLNAIAVKMSSIICIR